MTEAIPESECLRGKVAAVTRAARGIGRATAIAFAREGADVIGLDICAPVDPRSGVEPSTQEDLEETGRLEHFFTIGGDSLNLRCNFCILRG